jgi:hypothetical protein
LKEWTTPDSCNTPSTTNLEGEEIVDAPGKDGNASMPEQVKLSNPWRKMMMMMMMMNIFFLENRAVCEIMWKYIVEQGRPQVAIWRIRIACWIPKTTTKTHKLRICNTYLLSTATFVERTRLNITLYLHCLSCLYDIHV